MFRARLVGCGYSQTSGTDFSETCSPVANDITFRLVLVAMLVVGSSGLVFDVETAFLLGDPDKKTCVKCPEGMMHEEDERLLLMKTICGLAQSSRVCHEKHAGVMRDLGFERSQNSV